MKRNQIATMLNNLIVDEITGATAVANEDLTNIVDVGATVLNYTGDSNANYDSFIGKLIDQVGKVMFADRTYISKAPNIMSDAWEYGSVLQKVRCEAPDAQDNATWDLDSYPMVGGAAYPDPFEITEPSVDAKFFNAKTTYEIPITITQIQFKEAFKSAEDMGRFIAMIENRIQMKITLCNDALIMRTIVNLAATKINKGENVVNLLALYNATLPATSTPLTAAEAYTNPDFLRFASKTIALYKKYIQEASTLYNGGDYLTFTPEDRLKFVVLSDFAKSMDAYLYSDTFHNEFVKLPGYDEVGFWQGTGTANGDRSSINVKVADSTQESGKATVSQTGLVAVMFDEWAAMVCNQNYRTTSSYNPRGEYTNFFYKWDAHYLTDDNENAIVFIIEDEDEDTDET